jgi:hypothetical protein
VKSLQQHQQWRGYSTLGTSSRWLQFIGAEAVNNLGMKQWNLHSERRPITGFLFGKQNTSGHPLHISNAFRLKRRSATKDFSGEILIFGFLGRKE